MGMKGTGRALAIATVAIALMFLGNQLRQTGQAAQLPEETVVWTEAVPETTVATIPTEAPPDPREKACEKAAAKMTKS